jgi:hypothetical protein
MAEIGGRAAARIGQRKDRRIGTGAEVERQDISQPDQQKAAVQPVLRLLRDERGVEIVDLGFAATTAQPADAPVIGV